MKKRWYSISILLTIIDIYTMTVRISDIFQNIYENVIQLLMLMPGVVLFTLLSPGQVLVADMP
jgi:hypothetical protein